MTGVQTCALPISNIEETSKLYNDQTGRREEVTMPKEAVAIVENPLYTVMNEPNSTLQRLIRKLGLLDIVAEK